MCDKLQSNQVVVCQYTFSIIMIFIVLCLPRAKDNKRNSHAELMTYTSCKDERKYNPDRDRGRYLANTRVYEGMNNYMSGYSILNSSRQ